MENLISVVVCTYNQEATIARTLDSILMQQCHVPYEIILGEDCSTDGTLAICETYASKHPDKIRLLANKENKGLLDNYFDCILASHGQYIADCAGDDFWIDPLKLEKEVTILEQQPDVTLVHTDWYSYQEATSTSTPSPKKPFTAPLTAGQAMLEAIITQTRIPVVHLCTSLYRASVIRQALREDPFMFRNKEFGCEDVQVAFVMALQGKIAYLSDVTLNYSQGQETVSFSLNYHKQFTFAKRVGDLSHYIATKYGIESKNIERYFYARAFELGMYAFRAYDPQLCQETIIHTRKWVRKPSMSLRLLFFVMRHPWLWRIGLQARRIFVTTKQLLRQK